MFILVLSVFGGIADAALDGFWIGNNPGATSEGSFEVFFGKDSHYEIRNKDIHKDGSTRTVTYTHGIGKWRSQTDSMFYFLENAKLYDSNLTEECCIYTGQWRGIGIKSFEEGGKRKLLYLMEYEGIRDTAYFEYLSDSPSFTFPGPLSISIIIRVPTKRLVTENSLRFMTFRGREYNAIGKRLGVPE